MTKGGVMIGSTVSMRSAPLRRKPVRVAISAKARPSTVEPTPTSTARNSVFQATPQRRPPARQSSPQTEVSVNLSRNAAGEKPPALSWKALARIVVTGKNTKIAISATTSAIEATTKTSPRHQARAASPWQSSIRKASPTSAAPKPMPPWRGPGAPKRSASQAALQPRCPMAKPSATSQARPRRPARTSHRAVVSRSARTRSGSVATLRGTRNGRSHHALPTSANASPLPASPNG